jgi:GT2 family glycosyltransferase
MKTCIVTLTYNQPKLIEDLALSLQKFLPKNGWQWFIRDNSSDDLTQKVVEKIGDQRITVIKKENKGNYASMHNDLMREGYFAGYDLLLLLNNDMVAMTDFLTPMRDKFRDPDVGATGALLLYPNMSIQHCGIIISPNGMPYNVSSTTLKHFQLWPNLHEKDREYQAVTGACLMLRVKDYEHLGGMDERFQWCFDDVDLCLRITQQLKKKCVYCHSARLIHYENFSTLKNPTELKPNLKEALPLLMQKFAGQLKIDSGTYQMDYGRYR